MLTPLCVNLKESDVRRRQRRRHIPQGGETAKLRNSPDITTSRVPGPRYVTAVMHTWQGRFALYRIYELMVLLTAFMRDSSVKEAERLQHPSEGARAATEKLLPRHTRHIFLQCMHPLYKSAFVSLGLRKRNETNSFSRSDFDYFQ